MRFKNLLSEKIEFFWVADDGGLHSQGDLPANSDFHLPEGNRKVHAGLEQMKKQGKKLSILITLNSYDGHRFVAKTVPTDGSEPREVASFVVDESKGVLQNGVISEKDGAVMSDEPQLAEDIYNLDEEVNGEDEAAPENKDDDDDDDEDEL
jgi:hypothetical protein